MIWTQNECRERLEGEWRTSGRGGSHAGSFWIAQNMFIHNVQLIRTGKDLAGNRSLLAAKNYLTSNGNVKTAGSLKSVIPKDGIFLHVISRES